MRLSETVKPISYVKSHAAEIVRDISGTQQPVIITQNGEARAVLMNLAEYENIQDSLAMLKLAATGSEEVRKGKIKNAAAAFESINAEIDELKKAMRE
jgi:prevent-host-death family protein